MRDFVLGVRLLDGKGDELRFGGQVMKNVAGYDVSRLLAGSLGTLGVILEVSLKVLPLPAAEATLRFEHDAADAIARMNEWARQAAADLAPAAWHDGAACAAVRRRSGGRRRRRERSAASGSTERAHASGRRARATARVLPQRARPLWRLSLPPTTPPLDLPGAQLIEWGGALRWLATDATRRRRARSGSAAGGHATLFRGGDKSRRRVPAAAAAADGDRTAT